MVGMRELWQDVGITGQGALAVVASAVGMYAAFALVLHQWGERLRNSRSATTIALAALLGSISARAILGNHPTMGGGLVALATLLVLERVFGVMARATRRSRRRRLPTNQ